MRWTVLQIWMGNMPASIESDLAQTRQWAHDLGYQYIRLSDADRSLDNFVAQMKGAANAVEIIKRSEPRTARVVLSDLTRLAFLAEYAPGVYFDADCVPLSDDLLEGEGNACGQYGAARDNYLLIARDREIYERMYGRLLERIERYGAAQVVDSHVVINGTDELAVVPKRHYRHTGSHG